MEIMSSCVDSFSYDTWLMQCHFHTYALFVFFFVRYEFGALIELYDVIGLAIISVRSINDIKHTVDIFPRLIEKSGEKVEKIK